jgi:ribosome assembly protein 1
MNASKGFEGVRGRFNGSSVSNLVNFTIRGTPLPEDIVHYLQKNAGTLQSLLAEGKAQDAEIDASMEAATHAGGKKATRPEDFWKQLVQLLDAEGGEWKGVADHIWAFGPKQVGPNILIDMTGSVTRG